MNYLQLCQKLRQEVGGSGNGPSTVLNQSGENRLYVDWINDAWLEIQNRRRSWRFMWTQGSINLQLNTQAYSLPSDFKSVDEGSVKVNGHRMIERDYAEFRDNFFSPQQGRPYYFCRLPNGLLKLNSVPNQSYTVTFDYFKKAQPLIENTDTPSLPDEYHLLIVYLAMKSYGGYENAMEVYQRADVKYNEMLMDVERTQLPELMLAGELV